MTAYLDWPRLAALSSIEMIEHLADFRQIEGAAAYAALREQVEDAARQADDEPETHVTLSRLREAFDFIDLTL